MNIKPIDNKKSPQAVTAASEEGKFKGVDRDFGKTINEQRIENGLSPIANPEADCLLVKCNVIG